MYYVYVLQLKDKSYYHGSAADLKERLKDHENGSTLILHLKPRHYSSRNISKQLQAGYLEIRG